MRYERVITHMNISDGQYEEIVRFCRLLHRLKIINIVSINPGRWASDVPVPTEHQMEHYIRLVMRVKKM